MSQGSVPRLGSIFFILGAGVASVYFVLAAVQGEFGLIRRMEVQAEADALRIERDLLRAEVARMENLAKRLSDDFLDLDLLDEQAREVLGLIRTDEIVIR